MKRFKLYSILFVLSFFLFTCEDDGSENVKDKDKFTSVHDKTFWKDSGNFSNEAFYFTKDHVYMYYEESENGVEWSKYCEKIPIKDGKFTDQEGTEYLLNVLVNKEDTLTLQFAHTDNNVIDYYFGAGEMDFVVRGNLLKVTMHYLEENGEFDSEEWGGPYIKTDDSERPTEVCPYDTGG